MSSEMKRQLHLIANLDLEPIAYKLVHPEPGVEGLSVDEADRRIALYRQYLSLIVMYPGKSIVPSKDIDDAWHTHILDTGKYAADCDAIFGFFLHHFPYLGLRGVEDEARWREQAAETHQLFKEHFGIELAANSSGACSDSGCGGSACDGGSCDSGSCSSGDTSDLLRVRPRLVRA